MKKASENIWVELVGNVIIARIRGVPSETSVRECQIRLVAILADTGCKRIVYDALELDSPSADVALAQQSLTSALTDSALRIAIVVANTKVAYFARLAFGGVAHRVFYSDMAGALAWLDSAASPNVSLQKGSENIWVELVGSVIIARIRGTPSETSVRECQSRLVTILSDTGCKRIVYDALELDNPSADVAVAQQSLTSALADPTLRIAIVVASTKVAYLARLAFGETNHRVFYNDMASALTWLESAPVVGSVAPFTQQGSAASQRPA